MWNKADICAVLLSCDTSAPFSLEQMLPDSWPIRAGPSSTGIMNVLNISLVSILHDYVGGLHTKHESGITTSGFVMNPDTWQVRIPL